MVALTTTSNNNNNSTQKSTVSVSAQNQIQMLAMQFNAAFEIQVRHFDHTPNQKAWKVQIVWNGQTVANMIDSDRSHAINKANQVALKNVEKLVKPIVLKQKQAEKEVADVKEGTKLDSFGRQLEEYIQSHPTPKQSSTISTQTDATDKLSVPAVKGMSRVESYVEIKIAENQPILKPKDEASSDDSDSTTSEDENNTTLVGMYGMLEKYVGSFWGAIPTPYSGSCYVTTSSSS